MSTQCQAIVGLGGDIYPLQKLGKEENSNKKIVILVTFKRAMERVVGNI